MASIDKRANGSYRARWHEFPGGPQKTRQFDRKVDAQRFLDAHGCSVKVVQRRLGHRSAVETLDTYSHLWPDHEDETRDAVDTAMRSGVAL